MLGNDLEGGNRMRRVAATVLASALPLACASPEPAGISHAALTAPAPLASVWSFQANQVGARSGSSVFGAGDVNGDGYAEVIVGAGLWDGGEQDEGKVWLFEGGPGGSSAVPTWTFEPDQADARLCGENNCSGLAQTASWSWEPDQDASRTNTPTWTATTIPTAPIPTATATGSRASSETPRTATTQMPPSSPAPPRAATGSTRTATAASSTCSRTPTGTRSRTAWT